MSAKTYAINETPVSIPTLTQLFLDAVDKFGAEAAFGRITEDLQVDEISYADVLDGARRVGGALEAHGVLRGDRAAILSHNRLEWALADYGSLCAGVVVVPIYPTLTAQQVAYILRDSGAKLVFVPDSDLMDKVIEARAECGHEVQVVVFDAPGDLPEHVISWAGFLEDGLEHTARLTEEEFRARALQAGPDEVATVLYTSGTTGDPKGVMLTHGNVGSNVEGSRFVLGFHDDDVTVSFLPLSHIFQRMVDYLFFSSGVKIVHARTMLTAVDDMKLVGPTVGTAVPRVYEKIHEAVMDARGVKKSVIDWAVSVADRMAGLRLDGRTPSGLLSLQMRLAHRLVFSKVHDAVGGNIRLFVSGSAPLSPVLNRFFYSIGLTILEGYGLTETSPVTNVNSEQDFRIGTVGKAIPGTEIRIADDGEILVRGPQVMKGYYNRPKETAQAIDGEGWFHTGDVGELDEDGFLRITDRKKDIIVTAGGKNIAPQPVENRLRNSIFIEQAVMVGDRRKFPSVLIVPTFSVLESWASEEGLEWSGRSELLGLPEVVRHMESEVHRGLEGLASFETPKKIALLDEEFTIQNGSLTPTLKVKRRVVQARFQGVIDQLYSEEGSGESRR